jgi:hypothetical protein
MKLVLPLLFVIITAAGPASADSQINCETVRAYVKQVGFVQAKAQARAAGMTVAQERMAGRCLSKRD